MEGNGETNAEPLAVLRRRVMNLTDEYNRQAALANQFQEACRVSKYNLEKASDQFSARVKRVYKYAWQDFSKPPPEVPDDVWNSFDKKYWKDQLALVEVDDDVWALLEARYPSDGSSTDSNRITGFIIAPELAIVWQVAAKNKDRILAALNDDEIWEIVSADFEAAVPDLWDEVPWAWIKTLRCDAADCWYKHNIVEWKAYYVLKLKDRFVYLCDVCIKSNDCRQQALAYKTEMVDYLTEQLCAWFGKRET